MYEIKLFQGQSIVNSVGTSPTDTFVGTLRFGDLAAHYQIPHRVHSTNEGYQRMASANRVNSLARDLHNQRVDLPTAVLMSIRERDLYPRPDSSGFHILTLPADGTRPIFIVDGQHRVEALKKAMDEDPDGGWYDYMLNAVIMFGAGEEVEMDQFHTINSKQKGIPTDLTFDLMVTLAVNNSKFKKYLVEAGEDWKIISQQITEQVAKRDTWKGKIRFSNETKGKTLIKSNSFATSLRHALDQVNFAKYNPNQRTDIIDAYWQGILNTLPDCFDRPDDYNIQKTVGVTVLNYLLPRILSFAQDWGSPIFEPETYKNILGETLRNLTGDNQFGNEAVGTDFWRVGAQGASGVYSSHPGRRVLRAKIINELEENLNNGNISGE